MAQRAQILLLKMLHNRTQPATAQPAPVIDRYSGLMAEWNSTRISHPRKAAVSRTPPHAMSINTIHRSRVTPKGLFPNFIV